MGKGLDQLYAKRMREHFGYFACWAPNTPVAIGDYGSMDGPLFRKLGNLSGVTGGAPSSKALYEFSYAADRSISTDGKALAEAGVASGNVLLQVQFKDEAAISFSAPDGQMIQVPDLKKLGDRLIEMHKKGDWNRSHYIVIEVIKVPKATILVSEKASAEAKFEVGAKSPVSAEVMANLSASTSLKISRGVGAQVVGEGPLTPLFRLAFLHKPWFQDPVIRFRGRGGAEEEPKTVELSSDLSLHVY